MNNGSIPNPPKATSHQNHHDDALLELAVSSAGAVGGAMWHRDVAGEPQVVTQRGLGETRVDAVHQSWPGHADALQQSLATEQPRALTARFESVTDSDGHDLRLMLIPFRGYGDRVGVCELFMPTEVDRDESAVTSRVQLLLNLSQSAMGDGSPQSDYANWLSRIHQHLSVRDTAFAIANETQHWSGWDRVCVVVQNGWTRRVEAISGLEFFDRRSGAVRALEQLVGEIAATAGTSQSDVVSFPSGCNSEELKHLSAQFECTEQVVIPLLEEGSTAPCGWMVCERFEKENESSPREHRSTSELEVAGKQAAVALSHALSFEKANVNPVSRWLRNLWSKPSARWLLILCAMSGILIALCTIPGELSIGGRGVVEPEHQRDIFANINGLIHELHIEESASVAMNDELLSLRSPELDFHQNKLDGELKTISQQIQDLETLRSDSRRVDGPGQSVGEIDAKIEELKTVRNSVGEQIALLKKQQTELTLTSPMNGSVLTWQVNELLSVGRPVSRGDRLLTVAQLDGPWVLRMYVDHRDIGPVQTAIAAGTAEFSFVSTDNPNRSIDAVFHQMASSVEVDPISGPSLEIVAIVERDALLNIRPGSTVQPRITCGTAPIGYVWFRRFVDGVSAWWSLKFAK